MPRRWTIDPIKVLERFPTQEVCIKRLERARWAQQPSCPHCGSDKVARKRENDRVGRWNCHSCKSSFNALSGTIFQGARIPLKKWFAAIAIMLHAKNPVSSHQLGRDLNINQSTAHRMGRRIGKALKEDRAFLKGIVESENTGIDAASARGRSAFAKPSS